MNAGKKYNTNSVYLCKKIEPFKYTISAIEISTYNAEI